MNEGDFPCPSAFAPWIPTEARSDHWHHGGSPPVQRQGWKVYVSFTAHDAIETLQRTVPVLAQHEVAFKYIRSFDHLASLNAGRLGYSQIGKCLVCYIPEPNIELIGCLVSALSAGGVSRAPIVPFALDICSGIPLFYRYGSYVDWDLVLDDEVRLDVRHNYRAAVPEGVIDWIAPIRKPSPESAEHRRFLLRYPAFSALWQQGKSGVFAALDVASERYREVILKVGYRDGALQADGTDGRDFVRNEIRMYGALDGAGLASLAPRLVDSHDHNDLVVLVLERVPGVDLLTLLLDGRLTLRDVRRAWEVLCVLNARHFFLGDAKIGNFMRSDDNRVIVIDLETAGRTAAEMERTRNFRTFSVGGHMPSDPELLDRRHFLASLVFDYSKVREQQAPLGVVDRRSRRKGHLNQGIVRWAAERVAEAS